MKTRVISSLYEPEKALKLAKNFLTQDDVVVIPSETVYGLGANIYSEKGIEKIYVVKKRPKDNPLICHIASLSMLEEIAEVPKDSIIEALIEKFWPGPLTFVFSKKQTQRMNYASFGFDTVAVRMPSHPVFLKLIKLCDFPIAAPSANISGRPSGTHFKMIEAELSGKIPLILKDSQAEIGIESTVLDLTTTPYQILRPGAITFEDLKELIPNISFLSFTEKEELLHLHSPGLKYKHYKPKFKIFIYNELENVKTYLHKHPQLKSPYFIFPNKRELVDLMKNGNSYPYFSYKSLEELSHQLYSYYVQLEDEGVDALFIKAIEEKGFGRSLMERIKRSADEILS